jgi:hypothetical protein
MMNLRRRWTTAGMRRSSPGYRLNWNAGAYGNCRETPAGVRGQLTRVTRSALATTETHHSSPQTYLKKSSPCSRRSDTAGILPARAMADSARFDVAASAGECAAPR